MFTGIIEEIGTVREVRRTGNYQRFTLGARTVLEGTRIGDSIAIDGVCQTVTALSADGFTVEALGATPQKTTLGSFLPGRRVNLERALTPHSRLGGHFVQGHVEGTAPVVALRAQGVDRYLTIRVPAEIVPLCLPEGSIAIDGISLTIAELKNDLVTINVIPATWTATTLGERRVGDRLNVESDLLGRYVARLLRATDHGLSAQKLSQWGYR